MYKLLIVLVSIGSVFPVTLPAQSTPQTSPFKVFDLESDPAFQNYKQVVTEFAHAHRPKARNDFCVFGYASEENLKSAWVIWRQGRQIILWEGGELDASRRKISLSSDVVASEKDLHGSTYRVTRAWVEQVETTCARSGIQVHIPAGSTSH